MFGRFPWLFRATVGSAPKRPRIHRIKHRAPPPLDHTGTWASIQRSAADRDPHGGISLGIEIVIEQHRVARRSRERSAESRAAGLSQSQAERGGGRSRRQPSRRIAGGGSAGGGGSSAEPPTLSLRLPYALHTGRSSQVALHRPLITGLLERSSQVALHISWNALQWQATGLAERQPPVASIR